MDEVKYPLGTLLSADQAMLLAIAEARKGQWHCSPNPRVGCVVLDDQGKFLASGYHEYFGGPHAEVKALTGLTTDQLKGAQVFVTLEPCAHEGKTPSCAKMLAQLPIQKVIYGLVDPNPLVSGQGIAIIEKAGIKTELFDGMQSELEEVCEHFLWNQRQKLPFVSLKLASSLDGQIALKNGESQWITNAKSREHVHYLRAMHSAVLIGSATFRLDNPTLNIRYPGVKKFNKVIVLDPKGLVLNLYHASKLSEAHRSENVYWIIDELVLKKNPQWYQNSPEKDSLPHLIGVPSNSTGQLDLNILLQKIWNEKIYSVLIEGGARTASAFLERELVNRLYLFLAPLLIGAQGGRSWTEGMSIAHMQERLELKNPQHLFFDKDILITGLL